VFLSYLNIIRINMDIERRFTMQKVWNRLEKEFTEWDIHHVGGGNFVIRKDFAAKNGSAVMVALTDTGAFAMRDKDNKKEFISVNEFNEHPEVYWEEGAYHLEVQIIRNDEKLSVTEEAEIFNKIELEEILAAVQKMENIIWDN